MIALFDYDSLIYQAVPNIADSDDIRKWFREGRTKDWMREEIVILILNKLEQMGNNIFSAIEESGIVVDSYEYYLTNDVDSIRRKVFPEYKIGRRKERPDKRNKEGLVDADEWIKVKNAWKTKNMKRVVNRVRRRLIDMNFAETHPEWEADDLVADRARELKDPNFIIISMDKDMKQIPGLFFDFYREPIFHNYCEFPKSEDQSLARYGYRDPVLDQYGQQLKDHRGLNVVTEYEADRFKWLQVIMGDSGDGIKGIPRVGKVKANRMLDGAIDNDFETTAWLAYKEHYDDIETAKYQFDLHCFLIGLGTGRSIEHLMEPEEC